MKRRRGLGALLPHVSVSLSLAVAVMVILDVFNPRMGFLSSTYSRIVLLLAAVIALVSGIRSAALDRREAAEETEEKTEKERRSE